jgi:transposase
MTTPAPPADDVERLNGLLAERDARLADQAEKLAAATDEITYLKVQLAKLRHMLFGRSSEKMAAEIRQLDLLELRLEDLEETEAAAEAQASKTRATGEKTSRKPALRRPLPDHLPREEVVHHPGDSCPCCGGTRFAKLGEDVTEVLEKIPVRLKVIRHVRPKLSCRHCSFILQAPAPDLPIDKGRPGPRLLAHVVVSKYLDGLPLYRQSTILRREGVEIERATLADWVGHVAWWVLPVAELVGEEVMASPVLFTDDTTVKVLAPGAGKTRIARFWAYIRDERPWQGTRPPAAYYRYSPDRKGERPREHLAGFTGYLHADAFPGYEALYRSQTGSPAIVQVACMAHARREFHDRWVADKSPVAKEALRRIQDLYAIEAKIHDKIPDMRLAVRRAEAVPRLEELKNWLMDKRRRLSAKSAIGKAIQYSLGRWDALVRYTTDGRLGIDNNPAERALRGICLARKNFLFLGSDAGGERAAAILTLLETAKLNGLDPEAYFADIIDRLVKGHPVNRLHELLPWTWAAAPTLDNAA